MDLLGQFLRFSSVGVLATLVHFVVALSFAVYTNPYMANLAGFLAAFGFSYLGHQNFTFQIARHNSAHARRLPRFLVTSLSALLLSQAALAIAEQLGAPSVLSLILAAALIPPYSFLISRLWVFHDALANKAHS